MGIKVYFLMTGSAGFISSTILGTYRRDPNLEN